MRAKHEMKRNSVGITEWMQQGTDVCELKRGRNCTVDKKKDGWTDRRRCSAAVTAEDIGNFKMGTERIITFGLAEDKVTKLRGGWGS